MAFRGWPAEALEFFEGLEADNSRTYWQDHRAVYDAAVRGPMDELLAELAPEFGAGKVFRPYRDVRFSADKTPYKTHLGAVLDGGGYVQLSAEGLAAGLGYWHMSADQLDRFRRAVADDRTGEPLAAVARSLGRLGIEITSIESLKTAPRGYPKDHPRVELLRHKGLAAYRSWPAAAWLGARAAKTRVVGFLRTARPLMDWLDDHVGPARG
ncbi:MAG: DUF2461 domain-containing protein [Acidimicrobiales bacterium]